MTADMSQMDEDRVTRYLLGELPDEEQAEIEEALLADDSAWEAVRLVEDDLVDDYVRGRLDRTRRAQVAARVAASPRLQQRVAFARDLHVRARAQPSERRSISRLGEWLGARTRWLALAGVGLAAVLIAIAWPRSDRPGAGLVGSPPPVIASLVLQPATRAAPMPSVAIDDVAAIAVTVVLDPEEVFARYRLRVVGARGQVWAVDALTGTPSSVETAIPTHVLVPGTYQLELTGLRPDGTAAPLGSRAFRVTGPAR